MNDKVFSILLSYAAESIDFNEAFIRICELKIAESMESTIHDTIDEIKQLQEAVSNENWPMIEIHSDELGLLKDQLMKLLCKDS